MFQKYYFTKKKKKHNTFFLFLCFIAIAVASPALTCSTKPTNSAEKSHNGKPKKVNNIFFSLLCNYLQIWLYFDYVAFASMDIQCHLLPGRGIVTLVRVSVTLCPLWNEHGRYQA